MVRSPWDWAASSYAFNRGLHRPLTRGTQYSISPTEPERAADWSFKQWLRWWIDTSSPSQLDMLVDEQGTCLVDRIIRFEDLEREFPKLCLKLGIFPRFLPKVNRTPRRRPNADYYDRETHGWIAEHFARDLAYFGYSEDGSLLRGAA